jgi:ribose transport system substrate-binding protein
MLSRIHGSSMLARHTKSTKPTLIAIATAAALATTIAAGLTFPSPRAGAATRQGSPPVPTWLRSPDGVRMAFRTGGICGKGSPQYYWVSAISTLPLFVANDFPVLFRTAKELKVCAHVAGPAAMDISGDFAAIEETCALHPAGVMVVGLDASLAPAINKCISEKVPTVTIDVDVPNSNRLAFIGGNFVTLGQFIADNMIYEQKRLKHRTTGEIALTMDTSVPSNYQIESGIASELKAKGWKFDGYENDSDTAAGGASASSALIIAHPHLSGIISIGSEPGPGTVEAVAEAHKQGQILVTAGQNNVAFAKDIESGKLAAFFGPRRVNITQFGLLELYQFNNPVGLVNGLNKWQFPPIAPFVDVGAYAVDSSNVKAWIAANSS